MKTLIVYYSFTENNEKLARYLQKRLNCDLAKIETVKKRIGISIMLDLVFGRKPKLKPLAYRFRDYDHIIFIGPIWAGKIAMPLKALIENEVENVKQYSFITLCGGAPGQKEKIEKELVSVLRKGPMKVLELWVNDLLPAEQKNTIKHTSGFRIEENGFGPFEAKLRDFIKEENLINAI